MEACLRGRTAGDSLTRGENGMSKSPLLGERAEPIADQSGPLLPSSERLAANAFSGLFGEVTYWAIFWSGPIAVGWAVATIFDRFISPAYAKLGFIACIVSGLSAAVALSFGSNSNAGKAIALRIRCFILRNGILVALVIGVFAGWIWRANYVPDRDRADAEYAALLACRQIPTCLQLAKRENEFNEVDFYLQTLQRPSGW